MLHPTKIKILKAHDQVEACAVEIEGGAKTTLEGIARAGCALGRARELFGKNDKAFGQWREKRLPWLNRETSLRWIQVSEKFGGNLLQQNVAVEPSALYLLAAPSTPEESRTEAKERASKGEKITHKVAQEIKQKHKPAPEKPEDPLPPPLATSKSVHPFEMVFTATDPRQGMGPFDPRPKWDRLPEGWSIEEYPDTPAGKAMSKFRDNLAVSMNQLWIDSGMNQFDVCRFVSDIGEEFLRLLTALQRGPTLKKS